MAQLEDSLRRLQVETIDLMQIHWPTDAPGEIEEAWGVLAGLQQAGKLRRIGVSNFDAAQMQRVGEIAPVTSLQPPYSLLRRGIEAEILPYCMQAGIGVILYSPMYSGLLTGAMTRQRAANLPDTDWRKRDAEFQEPLISRNLALVECIREISARHGYTPGEAAIAWTLRHPGVTGAIVGARSVRQVEGVVGAMDFRLSQAELAEVENILAS